MDDLVVGFVAQHFFNLARMQALDTLELLRAVVDEAAGKLAPGGVETPHALADAERTVNIFEPGGKQAAALVHERLDRAVVDHDVAGGLEIVRDPVLAVGEAIFLGNHPRTALLARVEDPLQNSRFETAGNERGDAGRGGFFCGTELGFDAAGAELALAFADELRFSSLDVVDDRNQLRIVM